MTAIEGLFKALVGDCSGQDEQIALFGLFSQLAVRGTPDLQRRRYRGLSRA